MSITCSVLEGSGSGHRHSADDRVSKLYIALQGYFKCLVTGLKPHETSQMQGCSSDGAPLQSMQLQLSGFDLFGVRAELPPRPGPISFPHQDQPKLLELRQPGEGGGHGLSALVASVPTGRGVTAQVLLPAAPSDQSSRCL